MNDLAGKIGDLMKLAYRANKETEHAVFLEYSGHVDRIHLRVSESKRLYFAEIFYEYLLMEVYPEMVDETLERWMEYLNGLVGAKS